MHIFDSFFSRSFVISESDPKIKKNIKTELMGMLIKKYRHKPEVIQSSIND